MYTLIHDLRYAFRMLLKRPAFTGIALLTLALGIGANTAIFTIVNAVLLNPLPYPSSEKLMELGRVFPGSNEVSALSEAKLLFLRDSLNSFDAITATQGLGPNTYLSDANESEYIRALAVTSDFFSVLGVSPRIGRAFTKEEDSPAGGRVTIIGDGIWQRRFGSDPAMLGKSIDLNGRAYSVVGIMPPGFEYFGPQDLFVPMQANRAHPNEGHNWTVIGRLKQGVTPDQARAEVNALFARFRETYPAQVLKNEAFGVQSWQENMTRSVRDLLWILLGAVGFVLLIACANVANLQLIRAAARQKEMAIRLAIGGGSWRLIRQLLTEGVLLALMGGAVGLLLAIWGLDGMRKLIPAGMIPRANEITLDWKVLIFCLVLSVLTGILFGLAPALQMLRVDLNSALKESAGKIGGASTRGGLRSGLVILEVALAVALTIGAGLLLRTFANLRGVDRGFEARNLLSFEISPRGTNYDTATKTNDLYRHVLERLRSLPGVEAAAVTNKLPLDRWFNLPYRLAGHNDFTGSVEYRLVSTDYFRVMKMSLLQGRSFDDSDKAGAEPVIIINEAFARRNFPQSRSLDQQLCVACERYGDPAMRRVIGVVNETKQRSLDESPSAIVFVPLDQVTEALAGILRQPNLVLRTTGDPLRLSAAVRSEMRRIDPRLPIRNLRSMEQLVDRSTAPQRFNLSLLALFAAVGLLLATVGIYGVIAYGVSQRLHEIGVRMALGAQARDVLKLVMKQGMVLVMVGVALGLGASYGLTRLMKSLLFGVGATDPATFASISLLLVTVALLACYIPARRATKVDPLVALRYE
jgi:putative ABC transport system permease protein